MDLAFGQESAGCICETENTISSNDNIQEHYMNISINYLSLDAICAF